MAGGRIQHPSEAGDDPSEERDRSAGQGAAP
jgi:hypothetical protein